MRFQSAVTFDSATRKKDRSVRLVFTTNHEVTTADYMQMDSQVLSEGWVLYAPDELQDADIPTEQATSGETKPKGQRMRSVFFLIWKKRGIEEPFENWYTRTFERILDKYKEELD